MQGKGKILPATLSLNASKERGKKKEKGKREGETIETVFKMPNKEGEGRHGPQKEPAEEGEKKGGKRREYYLA